MSRVVVGPDPHESSVTIEVLDNGTVLGGGGGTSTARSTSTGTSSTCCCPNRGHQLVQYHLLSGRHHAEQQPHRAVTSYEDTITAHVRTGRVPVRPFVGYRRRCGGLFQADWRRGSVGLWVWGSSTDGAPDRCHAGVRGPDHGDQRISRRPGFGQRAPFEHRNVHMRPTKDLADRICAGQSPATGAPPGTRTPNPRIKSPNPVISSGFGLCQLVSFPQVGNESPCRPVPSSAAPEHGHRALLEHRDRQPVLHRRTRLGSGATADAADFGSAGSVVTVTWSVAPVRSYRWVRPRRGRAAGWVVQPTGGVERTNAIESEGDVRALRQSLPLIRCLRCVALASVPSRRAAGECPVVGCQAVTGGRRRAPMEGTSNGRHSFTHMLDMRVIFVDISAARLGLSSSEMGARACRSLICA